MKKDKSNRIIEKLFPYLGILMVIIGIIGLSTNKVELFISVIVVMSGVGFLLLSWFNGNIYSGNNNLNSIVNTQNVGLRVFYHVLFWITYLMVHTGLMKMNVPKESMYEMIKNTSIYFIWIDMSATYFTLYLLIPLFLYKKKYVHFIFLFILSSIGFTLITQVSAYYFYIPSLQPNYTLEHSFWEFPYFYYLVATNGIVVLAASIKLTKRWLETQEMKSDLEKQQLKSELAMLKLQISPHFLFNTLNNIDTLIYTNQDLASDSIIKLSDLMRYMLYEANISRVPLKNEIEYIENLIELQTLRLVDSNNISFEIHGDVTNQLIAPLLFVPFIENAFKHGDKNSDLPAIIINLSVHQNSLDFRIENQIAINNSKEKMGGIGLSNVKRRLTLIYPDKHKLNMKIMESKYIVHLYIDLSSDSGA